MKKEHMKFDDQVAADGRMSFDPKEISNGKLNTFVDFLVSMECEIRIWTDGYCYIVEYFEKISKQDGNEFIAIDNYHHVVSDGIDYGADDDEDGYVGVVDDEDDYINDEDESDGNNEENS